jgi:hypothetical protein
VFFNGPDLRKPTDLLDRLALEALLPTGPESGSQQILPCLIFIYEVHGITNSVATALLNAMDDRRVTSIDGRLYDFNRVEKRARHDIFSAPFDAGDLWYLPLLPFCVHHERYLTAFCGFVFK